MADDEQALEGFDKSELTHNGITHTVYRAGSGPAVIVIHEIPGLHPGVIDFARRLLDVGFTVFMPSLFGTPGKPFSMPYAMRTFARNCVAREFTAFALDGPGPVMGWLRKLAAHAHAECGGAGVGAVGMCFTGGFALGMMVEGDVLAGVLSQPSLPLAVGRKRRTSAGIGDRELARVAERTTEGACVLGLRFTADRAVPAERFETLRRELGDRFIAVEIDSSKGNPHSIKRSAHSVLTVDLVDEPGHPTRAALEQVLEFLRQQLQPAGGREA